MQKTSKKNKTSGNTEETYWSAFLKGEKAAFSQLYECCYPKLYTYGINLGMNDSQIRDGIQEIFFKLYKKPEYITDASTLLPFLFSSIRNSYINILKKQSVHIDVEKHITSFTFEYSMEDELTAKEEQQALTKKIDKIMSCLTSRQKEIIYFRFLYDMEYEEIAKIMTITPQSARNTIYKAFEKIRKNFPNYLPYFIGLIQYSIK